MRQELRDRLNRIIGWMTIAATGSKAAIGLDDWSAGMMTAAIKPTIGWAALSGGATCFRR